MSHEHAIGIDLALPGGDMSALSVMRDDVLLFVTEITGLPLQPWQAEVLKSATEVQRAAVRS